MPTKRKRSAFDTSPDGVGYRNAYNKEHYKRITLYTSPEKKDEITAAAEKRGLSVAKYLLTSAEEYENNHPIEKVEKT